jgi:hypothetical protein
VEVVVVEVNRGGSVIVISPVQRTMQSQYSPLVEALGAASEEHATSSPSTAAAAAAANPPMVHGTLTSKITKASRVER